MLITIHNAETGEIIEREMNEQELAIAAEDKRIFELETEKQLQLENKKIALLEKLGITEEEAELLLTIKPQKSTPNVVEE